MNSMKSFQQPNSGVSNLFKDGVTYDKAALKGLCEAYQREGHPVSQLIFVLLSSVDGFYSASDPAYNNTRAQTMSDDELFKNITDVGSSFSTFSSEKESAKLSPLHKQIMDSALLFSMRMISKRLDDLEKNKDKIHVLYHSRENTLRDILDSPSSKTATKRKQ